MKIVRVAHEQQKGNVGVTGHKSELDQREIGDHKFDLVLRLEEGLDKVKTTLDTTYEEQAWTKMRGPRVS